MPCSFKSRVGKLMKSPNLLYFPVLIKVQSMKRGQNTEFSVPCFPVFSPNSGKHRAVKTLYLKTSRSDKRRSSVLVREFSDINYYLFV